MNVAVLKKVFAPKYLRTFEEGDIVVHVNNPALSVGIVEGLLDDMVNVKFWDNTRNCFYLYPFKMRVESLNIIGRFEDLRQ